jgi:hypothetical protein
MPHARIGRPSFSGEVERGVPGEQLRREQAKEIEELARE